MSLWWVKREQLDKYQVELIETLSLSESTLITGPPGSGKTNVMVRRAQFVRSQQMPNIMILTFTRSLTEFLKTGCLDHRGREIFPQSCVLTVESWLRWLYEQHDEDLPDPELELIVWKRKLAEGALKFRAQARLPQYDTLFVDEVQDLLPEEIELISNWSRVLFLAGDDRQRIFASADGLSIARKLPKIREHRLQFHYRLAREICEMADRILVPNAGVALESTCHYDGPTPGTIRVCGPLPRAQQLVKAVGILKDQIRAYGDLILQGERLAVIVATANDRDVVFEFIDKDPALQGKSKIIRARTDGDDEYDPSFDPETPICILTVSGCKGLEFRAVHWLFCDDLKRYHTNEHYYTVVTRAKTNLNLYFSGDLPQSLARAHSGDQGYTW